MKNNDDDVKKMFMSITNISNTQREPQGAERSEVRQEINNLYTEKPLTSVRGKLKEDFNTLGHGLTGLIWEGVRMELAYLSI